MPLTPAEPVQDQWSKLHKSANVAESGGEENNTATDFARHWAIAHIAETLIDEVSEYVILFEYLQDIAVLDSPKTPTEIALYQLKKRIRPSWTKSSLTSITPSGSKKKIPAKKAAKVDPKKHLKGKSILGKLYFAVHSATPLANASGILLTDAHFDIKGLDSKRITAFSKTPLDKLAKTEVEFIGKRLKKELDDQELKHLGSLHIEQTRMNPSGMREYVRGVISAFLEKKFPDKPNVSGALMEKMLQKFGQLSGLTPACNSLDDLVLHKGFTKTQFIKLVTESLPAKSWDEKLSSLVADLKAEGVSRKRADAWHDRAVSVHTGVVLAPQRALIYDWKLAKKIALETVDYSYKSTVEQIINVLRTEALTLGQEPLNDVELAAVALVAILDVKIEFTSSDKKPAEG
jgi:hypothetical protein